MSNTTTTGSIAFWLVLAFAAAAFAQREPLRETIIPCGDQTAVPGLVVERLALKPGTTVVEFGTGDGYMLRDLSRTVGPGGKVIGDDFYLGLMGQAQNTIARGRLTNVTLILGGYSDPKLPGNVADFILIHSRYEELPYPAKTLAALAAALKPTGRLAIVEYHKGVNCAKRGWEDVSKEVESNGYRRLYRMDRITSTQYLLVFAKK